MDAGNKSAVMIVFHESIKRGVSNNMGCNTCGVNRPCSGGPYVIVLPILRQRF